MKILFIFSFTIILLSACSKKGQVEQPEPDPVMILPELMITELNDTEVKQGTSYSIDLNRDGKKDVAFATWYIGNPNQQEDEILFFAASGTESSLLLGGDNDSPRFNNGDMINSKPVEGHDWYIVGQAEMAMKNIGTVGAPYWEKPWKDASHKFLAVRILKDDAFYYGWIEVSMDIANSKLILHRAAIGMVAEKPVKVGL